MITSLTDAMSPSAAGSGRGWSAGRCGEFVSSSGLRESPKFLLIVALATMREHLKVVGRELAATKDDRSG